MSEDKKETFEDRLNRKRVLKDNPIKPVNPTKAFQKRFKDGKFKLIVPPMAAKRYPDIDFNDKKALEELLKALPEELVIVPKNDDYVITLKSILDGINTKPVDPPKSKSQEFWESGDKIMEVFPEIRNTFNEAKTYIDSAGCTGCAKNSRTTRVLTDLARLHINHPERVIDAELMSILGASFGRIVSRFKYKNSPEGTIAVPAIAPGTHKLMTPMLHSHHTQGIRPSCMDCCRKHVAQAMVLFQEAEQPEYRQHHWLAIGHLAEAESECVGSYPDFADVIRDYRLAMMADRNYKPNLMELFDRIDDEEADALKAAKDIDEEVI